MFPPGDPAEADCLQERSAQLKDDFPRGVDSLPEEPGLLLQGAVAALYDLAQGHGFADLSLAAVVDRSVQDVNIVDDPLKAP